VVQPAKNYLRKPKVIVKERERAAISYELFGQGKNGALGSPTSGTPKVFVIQSPLLQIGILKNPGVRTPCWKGNVPAVAKEVVSSGLVFELSLLPAVHASTLEMMISSMVSPPKVAGSPVRVVRVPPGGGAMPLESPKLHRE
jgi:hypothetical protein